MSWLPESQDHLPLTWWKGRPIYLAALIALGGVASMVVTALLMASKGDVAGNGNVLEALIFTFANVADHGRIWTPLTYVLVNPPSLWFLITSYLFWNFGEQLERHLGRRAFVKLLVGLILVTPLLLSLVALTGPRLWQAVGMGQLEFGVFLAFATLYPRAKITLIILTIDAWILAAALVGVSALSSLAMRDWAGLFVLAGQVLFAYGFIRYEQGSWSMPSWSSLKPKPKLRLERKPRQSESFRSSQAKKATSGISVEEQVDQLLEKIHRQGLQSLSDEERRIMEKASESLRKKDS